MTVKSTALAVVGGPAIARPIAPCAPKWPRIEDEDIDALMALLRAGTLTEMANPLFLHGIETDLALSCGVAHGLLTNSGTAALHCALAGLGVGPGDEVVVPALTYIACGAAVVHQQAVPVFADVDPLTYNLTAETVAAVLSERTRAVMAVHLHGLPADMEAIRAVTAPHGIPLVEDFSQAFGASVNGRPVGGFGDVGVASLMAGKNLPAAGEAGVLVTRDRALRNAAARLKCFAHGVNAAGGLFLLHDSLGWNYRPSLLAVAMIPNQLFRLPEYAATRRAQAARLDAAIAAVPGCAPPVVPSGVEHAYHMYRFHLDPAAAGVDLSVDQMREGARRVFGAEGLPIIEFQNAPLPMHALFGGKPGRPENDYPGAFAAIRRSLVIGMPSQAPLCSPETVDAYIAGFAKLAERFDDFVAFAHGLPADNPPWNQAPRLF